MTKVCRGNYVFLTWKGDHSPRHVHVYRDCKLLLKWNLDDSVPMRGNPTPGLCNSLQAWYKRHLGIDVQEWGGTTFPWADGDGKPVAGTTVWSIGSAESDHIAPSNATFMVNYRVEDLYALVKVLREEGCNVLDKIDDSEYGKFAWVIDPEGNKVELWQPPVGQ